MEHFFRNDPERLGYYFHSNGFEKKRCVSGKYAKKSTQVFYRCKITIDKYWKVVKTTKNPCKLTTQEIFNEMITFRAVY